MTQIFYSATFVSTDSLERFGHHGISQRETSSLTAEGITATIAEQNIKPQFNTVYCCC